MLEMSTVGSSSGKRNSSKSGHVEGTESWPLVLPVVVAVVVGIVAIILVLLLVYLRRKRFLLDRNPKSVSVRRLIKSRKNQGDFNDGLNMGNDEEHGDHVTSALQLDDWIPFREQRPNSLTVSSVNNPNYETVLEVQTRDERVARNPIYQSAAKYEGRPGAKELEQKLYHNDINPLYELGPVLSTSAGSGGQLSQDESGLNPLYETTSVLNPLYESAAVTTKEPDSDSKPGIIRRRSDSRAKRGTKQGKEESFDHGSEEKEGADIGENASYGSEKFPFSTPNGVEPNTPPLPPATTY